MDYTRDVEKAAFDFLSDIEADAKAAIISGEEDVSEITCEESGYGEIRGFFHESVVDQSYSIEDAAYVIANCENEETDTGMWEGLEMDEAMQRCAAFSYGNDVWDEVESQYEGLLGEFEPSYLVVDEDDETVKEFTEDGDAEDWIAILDVEKTDKTWKVVDEDDETVKEFTEDGDAEEWIANLEAKEGRGNIGKVWQDWEDDNTTQPIETGGMDELFVLKRWMKLNAKAGTWGGYPLGSVYIDTRCGTGYSMPDVRDFYDYDVIARHKLPSMVGKYSDAVKERIAELEGITGKPYRVTVELEADQWGEIVTGLHEIAAKMADGQNEGAGWKLRIRDGA